MNRYLIGLLAFLLVVSCNQRAEESKFARLSGQINPAIEGFITLSIGAVLDSAEIQDDGSFSLDAPLEFSGTGMLIFNNMVSSIFLEPGKSLELSIRASKFPEIDDFSGDLGPVNHYLKLANKLEQQTLVSNDALFTKEVDEFKAYTDSVTKLKTQLLKEYVMRYPELDSAFVTQHKADIHYAWARQRLAYPGYHAMITGKLADLPDQYHQHYMQQVELNNPDLLISLVYQRFLEDYLDFREAIYLDQHPKAYNLIFPQSVARFRVILEEFQDTIVKDYVMFSSMNDHLDNYGIEHLETFQTNFDIHCQNEQYKTNINQKIERLRTLARGNPAPVFTAFDLEGNKVSLPDYAGSLLYVNLWASWSEWSLQEIPHWENLISQFQPLGVKFISISLDYIKDENLWKYLIREKELGGIHLIQDPKSTVWVDQYFVSDLPRYLLIDGEGKIISVHAPRPSENMATILEQLLNKKQG